MYENEVAIKLQINLCCSVLCGLRWYLILFPKYRDRFLVRKEEILNWSYVNLINMEWTISAVEISVL